jgi:AcrR family transcriptional regulator
VAKERMSADERREDVIRAAITEFAHGGYAGTSTAAIAARVGVSQPYLFRLFRDKRAIFLAAARRCTDEIRERFDAVSDGRSPDAAYEAMADAYSELIADRDRLLFQMQMYVAAATAEELDDLEFAAEIRSAWTALWDLVNERLGGHERSGAFMGTGMLINVLLAMGYPQDHRVWASCAPDGTPPAHTR